MNPFGFTSISGTTIISTELVDIDDDGDLDLFTGLDSGLTRFYENTGSTASPSFLLNGNTTPFGLTDVGTLAFPSFGDIDGDGDFDVVVGNGEGTLVFFANTGSASTPSFGTPTTNPLGFSLQGGYPSRPDLGDIDGDDDLDLIVNQYQTFLQLNTGNSASPTFNPRNPLFPDFGPVPLAPGMADIDGDGDLDLVVGGLFSVYWFQNMGSATEHKFRYVSNYPRRPLGIDDDGYYSCPAFGDLDGDGDLDAVVGYSDNELQFFANTGIADTNPPSTYCDSFNILVNSGPLQVRAFVPSSDETGVLGAELFVKKPGETTFSSAGYPLAPPSIFTFDYLEVFSEGVYEFYTAGHDAAGNVEPAPSVPDVVITVDMTDPTMVGPIVLLDPTTTDERIVRFGFEFSEPIGSSFEAGNVVLIGTLAPNARAFCEGEADDPSFTVCVVMDDPDAEGTIGVVSVGVVQDLAGNFGAISGTTSSLYTIVHHPPGDVNKDGTFGIADVALLADANLGLVTLP